MNINKKTELLLSYIDTLSSKEFMINTAQQDSIRNSLSEIYCDGYRHNYSEIYDKLQERVFSDLDACDTLRANIDLVLVDLMFTPDLNKDILRGFEKFADHIKLEIARNQTLKQSMVPDVPITPEEITSLREDVNNAHSVIVDVQVKAEKADTQSKKARNLAKKIKTTFDHDKTTSITILTIFSAVVLAFSGSVSFTSNVFNSMSASSPYRLVFILLITGFVLINTIFLLLYTITRMTGKSIETTCKHYRKTDMHDHSSCRTCGNGTCVKPYPNRIRCCVASRKYPYIFFINSILALGLYETATAWYIVNHPMHIEQQIIFYSVPVILILLLILLRLIHILIMRHRFIFQKKLDILKSYCTKIASSNSLVFGSAKNIITLLVSIHDQNVPEIDPNEKLIGTFINGAACSHIRWVAFNRRLKIYVLSDFTDETLINSINLHQHHVNKRIWRSYKKQLIGEAKKKRSADKAEKIQANCAALSDKAKNDGI